MIFLDDDSSRKEHTQIMTEDNISSFHTIDGEHQQQRIGQPYFSSSSSSVSSYSSKTHTDNNSNNNNIIMVDDRSLAHLSTGRPRIINDATLLQRNKEDGKNPTMSEYVPPPYVQNMHDSPRFGHTNRLGVVASSNPEDALDYAAGLKQFTLFIVVPFLIWGIILVLFKFIYGIDRIGCAAGGDVIDIKQLSKEGVSRKIRKKRIVRSWRLQTTFMTTGVLIPTISLLMMQSGWSKVQLAWEDVQEVVEDVEKLAFRGWNILEALQDSKQNLYDNALVQDVLQETKHQAVPLFTSWCPKAAQGDERLAFLQEAMSDLEDNTETLVALFDDYVPENANGFIAITHATESVDDSIEWFFAHDWIWKMYIMALNVFNIFLVLCVYIFSKHNIIHPPTRYYLTFFVAPLFSIFTILLLMVTASSGVATLLNADFCAGGDDHDYGLGSPQGTIRDAIFSYQHGNLDWDAQQKNLTGTLGLVYESFEYYANGCLTENPLAFLEDYASRVNQAAAYMVELTENLPDTPETVTMLNLECGGNVSSLPKSLKALEKELLIVQANVNAMVDMSSCHSISPLIRRLTHGSVCKESAEGLTWIWACSLVICICCFVMLTARAALYNPVKRRKKRDKKPKRVVEKEFEEYKQFMGEYYEDAAEWKLVLDVEDDDPAAVAAASKKKKSKSTAPPVLQSNPTFETANTTKPEDDDENDKENYKKDENRILLDIDIEDDESNVMLDMSHCGILSLAKNGQDEEDDDDQETAYKEGNELIKKGIDGTQHDTLLLHINEEEDSEGSSHDSDYESDSDDSEEGGESDDESALLSFFTETKSILSETKSIAASVASRTLRRIRTLRPLLGKAKDDDEDEEDVLIPDGISLADNSLFLRTPPTASERYAETGDGIWNYLTPPSKTKFPMLGSSIRVGAKTPMAPRKPFSFLGRVGDAEEHELAPLTMTPSMDDEDEIPSKSPGVHPRRLKLSPFMTTTTTTTTTTPSHDTKPKSKSKSKRSRMLSSSRLNLGVTTPERPTMATPERPIILIPRPIIHSRPRLGSDDSDDMSLYVEDAPKPPEKAYRRLARTSVQGKKKDTA